MSHHGNRSRRSAKSIVQDLTDSMLQRTGDEHVNIKLDVLQTIASRMGWNDLFEKIKNRHRFQAPKNQVDPEPQEKWWQK